MQNRLVNYLSYHYNSPAKADRGHEAFEESLKALDCEYIDLYLMHWPMTWDEHGVFHPKNAMSGLFMPTTFCREGAHFRRTPQFRGCLGGHGEASLNR